MQPLHMCRLKGFVAYPGEKKDAKLLLE